MAPMATVKDDEFIKSQKGVYILGKDIREIPCFRSSILAGITGGTLAGLISFMATSKAAMSSHIGFASLWIVVFAYWIPCRYKYETEKVMAAHAASAMYEKLAKQRYTPLAESEEKEKE